MEEEQLAPSQELANTLMSAPIPGQSLTKPMGHTPVERPAKITDVDEALEFFWDKFHDEDVFPMILGSLESGVEAELLMRSTVLGAVFNGFISIDLGMIVAQPVYAMICALGDRAGVKYTRRMKGQSQKDKLGKFFDSITKNSDKYEDDMEDEIDGPEGEIDDMMEGEGNPSMAILGGEKTDTEESPMAMLGGGMQ